MEKSYNTVLKVWEKQVPGILLIENQIVTNTWIYSCVISSKDKNQTLQCNSPISGDKSSRSKEPGTLINSLYCHQFFFSLSVLFLSFGSHTAVFRIYSWFCSQESLWVIIWGARNLTCIDHIKGKCFAGYSLSSH